MWGGGFARLEGQVWGKKTHGNNPKPNLACILFPRTGKALWHTQTRLGAHPSRVTHVQNRKSQNLKFPNFGLGARKSPLRPRLRPRRRQIARDFEIYFWGGEQLSFSPQSFKSDYLTSTALSTALRAHAPPWPPR